MQATFVNDNELEKYLSITGNKENELPVIYVTCMSAGDATFLDSGAVEEYESLNFAVYEVTPVLLKELET